MKIVFQMPYQIEVQDIETGRIQYKTYNAHDSVEVIQPESNIFMIPTDSENYETVDGKKKLLNVPTEMIRYE